MSEPEAKEWTPEDAACLHGPRLYGRLAGIVLGVLLMGFGWVRSEGGSYCHFWQAYYVAFCFYLSLSLGALFFVLLHHLVGATWSVVVMRVAEVFSANLLLMAVLFVPLAVAAGNDMGGPGATCQSWNRLFVQYIVGWSLPAATAVFLKRDFFLARCALYFAVWVGLALVFWRRSVAQDQSGNPALTRRNQSWSGIGMVLYGFSVAFGGIDLLMALSPPWQSTIFGVYFFAGCAVGFYALLPLAVMALQAAGRLRRAVTPEHYHDMGKLLFAFVFFWTYIAFSQYMLIWYADLPEETHWFLKRASPEAGPWNLASLALLFGHWMIPFAALLSREVKRRKALLAFWCAWLLLAHYLDLYWLAVPEWGVRALASSLTDFWCLVWMGLIYLAGALVLSGRHALLPVKDPRLAESLAFENY